MSCGLFNSHYFVTENNPSIVPGFRVPRFRLISTAHKKKQILSTHYTLQFSYLISGGRYLDREMWKSESAFAP